MVAPRATLGMATARMVAAGWCLNGGVTIQSHRATDPRQGNRPRNTTNQTATSYSSDESSGTPPIVVRRVPLHSPMMLCASRFRDHVISHVPKRVMHRIHISERDSRPQVRTRNVDSLVRDPEDRVARDQTPSRHLLSKPPAHGAGRMDCDAGGVVLASYWDLSHSRDAFIYEPW